MTNGVEHDIKSTVKKRGNMLLKTIRKLKNTICQINKITQFSKEVDHAKCLLGKSIGTNLLNAKPEGNLNDYEFKVFSQYGDDGIIQYLINKLNIKNKIFIEFGVQNYYESNTRFLLVNDYWRGLIIEGNSDEVKYIKKDDISWKYDLTVCNAFITKDNINELFLNNGFSGSIGILSIDIDGNDYWVWESINVVDPTIVIVEYNSLFGYERAVTVPYDKSFIRSKAHFSNVFYGASLKAFYKLAQKKGYAFIGTNRAGNNAYFVKIDSLNGLKEITVREGYKDRVFRESRDKNGNLNYLSKNQVLECIQDKELFDIEQQEILFVKDLINGNDIG